MKMKLDFFAKEKIIKYSVLLIVFAIILRFLMELSKTDCYEYVDNLCYECSNIGCLSEFIDYDMLSHDLKKQISKDDFKLSTDEEKYRFCCVLSDLDYEYKGFPVVYSTNKFRSHLSEYITIDGEKYFISVTIVFRPGLFFNHKIVDIDGNVIIR